jgi:hypothetical protein
MLALGLPAQQGNQVRQNSFKHNFSCTISNVSYCCTRQRKESLLFSVLSFACAKERTKEKHTGNDVQPLPGALIKLQTILIICIDDNCIFVF